MIRIQKIIDMILEHLIKGNVDHYRFLCILCLQKDLNYCHCCQTLFVHRTLDCVGFSTASCPICNNGCISTTENF
uniref:Putative ovule protein n=1 Tax=Solanum chacoense TaxID=4108 RepID=A0A0V0GSQ2_SOLCH